ncbi:MAG: alkaline shock response membrane anchor protein AmaP [Bacillota bacterium]
MKIFNRLLVVIFSLLIGTISLVTLFMALGWTIPLDYLNQVFYSINNRWIIGITSGLILLGAANLIFSSLMKNPTTYTNIANSDHGDISITIPAVEALVKKAAFQIRGVKEVKPVIKCTPQGIAVFIKTSMQPGTVIPEAAQELQTVVKGYLEETAGIQVVEVRVLITHVFQEAKSRVD